MEPNQNALGGTSLKSKFKSQKIIAYVLAMAIICGAGFGTYKASYWLFTTTTSMVKSEWSGWLTRVSQKPKQVKISKSKVKRQKTYKMKKRKSISKSKKHGKRTKQKRLVTRK